MKRREILEKPKRKKVKPLDEIDGLDDNDVCYEAGNEDGYNQAWDDWEAYLTALDERDLTGLEIEKLLRKSYHWKIYCEQHHDLRSNDDKEITEIATAIINAREEKRG